MKREKGRYKPGIEGGKARNGRFYLTPRECTGGDQLLETCCAILQNEKKRKRATLTANKENRSESAGADQLLQT